MDKASKLFTSKVSRRKLVQAGSAAAGTLAVTGALQPTFAAPYFAPNRFQGEKLTVLYMQSGTYDEAARLIAPEFETATGATAEVVAFPYQNLHDNAANDLVKPTGAYDDNVTGHRSLPLHKAVEAVFAKPQGQVRRPQSLPSPDAPQSLVSRQSGPSERPWHSLTLPWGLCILNTVL